MCIAVSRGDPRTAERGGSGVLLIHFVRYIYPKQAEGVSNRVRVLFFTVR